MRLKQYRSGFAMCGMHDSSLLHIILQHFLFEIVVCNAGITFHSSFTAYLTWLLRQ